MNYEHVIVIDCGDFGFTVIGRFPSAAMAAQRLKEQGWQQDGSLSSDFWKKPNILARAAICQIQVGFPG